MNCRRILAACAVAAAILPALAGPALYRMQAAETAEASHH